MLTDTEIKIEGLRALAQKLGEVDAERFVALIQRESFDYTAWQRTLWAGKSVDDISTAAMEARNLQGQNTNQSPK